MFGEVGTRDDRSEHRPEERRHDARALTSELAETLAVLVAPALLLSGINLFFS